LTTVDDVRAFLRDLPSGFISDATIRKQIEIAEEIVENEKSGAATEQTIESAILAQAGYLTYLAYATYIERGTGNVPPPMLAHLAELKELAERMLGYVRRGAVTSVNVYDLADSIWTEEVS